MNKLLASLPILVTCHGGSMEASTGGHEAEDEAEDSAAAQELFASISDQTAEAAGKLVAPSIDAVEFCGELATVKEIDDELLEVQYGNDTPTGTIARTVDYDTADGRYGGSIICRYEKLSAHFGRGIGTPEMDRLMALVRGHVTGIKIAESELGNPDQEWQKFYDGTLQDLTGAPLLDEHNRPLPGVDGILDVLGRGCIGSEADGSMPGGRFYERDQAEYAARMKWLRQSLHDKNFLKNARRWR